MSGYGYVAATVLLTVYGQLVVKWRVTLAGDLPEEAGPRLRFLLGLLLDPWILSGFAAALVAGLAWFAALAELDLSVAYPFTAASFIAVMLLSALFFAERLTTAKVLGTLLITAGIAVGAL